MENKENTAIFHTNNIRCAPVIIPTLCRYEHLHRCVESLRKNAWARYTDVYIGVDYPTNDSHKAGREKILAYLSQSFPEFASMHVIVREKNYGSGPNTIALREEIFQRYDRVIISEDDNEFSANFLEYMNQCLEAYKDDNDVIAVSGHATPANWEFDEGSTCFKCDFVFDTWGTAYWRDKDRMVSALIRGGYVESTFQKPAYREKRKLLSNLYYRSYVGAEMGEKESLLIVRCISDISLGILANFEHKYSIVPVISKVRNWGFDGSGTYCNNISYDLTQKRRIFNYPYDRQPIDPEDAFTLVEDSGAHHELNHARYKEFASMSRRTMVILQCKRILSSLIGRKLYAALYNNVYIEYRERRKGRKK